VTGREEAIFRGRENESPRADKGPAGRFAPRGGRGPGLATSPAISPGPYQAASPQLATSPIMRGQRSAVSRREALILQSLINHPWLLHDHLEEVAALELAHGEANKLRAGIIAAFANDHHHSPDVEEQAGKMRADLEARGLGEVLQRVERAITTSAVWGNQAWRGAGGCFGHLAATRCLASENPRPT
jgi:DNA primase